MQGPFYAEFKLEPQAIATGVPTTNASRTALTAAAAASTPDMILRKVQDAILAVLGTTVGLDEPLVEAGLDSLGMPFFTAQCLA